MDWDGESDRERERRIRPAAPWWEDEFYRMMSQLKRSDRKWVRRTKWSLRFVKLGTRLTTRQFWARTLGVIWCVGLWFALVYIAIMLVTRW